MYLFYLTIIYTLPKARRKKKKKKSKYSFIIIVLTEIDIYV